MSKELNTEQFDAFKRLLESLDTEDQAKAAGNFVMLLSDEDRKELWPLCETIISTAVNAAKAY